MSQQCGAINLCDAQLEAAVNGVPTRDSLWSKVTCNQGEGWGQAQSKHGWGQESSLAELEFSSKGDLATLLPN